MYFVRSHFEKMNLWPVEHFFEHICHHFWVGLLLHLLHTPKSDDKYAQKRVQPVRSDFLQNPYFRPRKAYYKVQRFGLLQTMHRWLARHFFATINGVKCRSSWSRILIGVLTKYFLKSVNSTYISTHHPTPKQPGDRRTGNENTYCSSTPH